MNLLIVSRISIPAKDRTLPTWEYLRELGHTVTVEHPDSVPSNQRPDVIVSWGVTIMEETFRALERFPGVPLFCFNWDVYAWVWDKPRQAEGGGLSQETQKCVCGRAYKQRRTRCPSCRRPYVSQSTSGGFAGEYDYKRYGDLLKLATEVWVPSACTGRRTTQWYGLTNWHTILSACPWWDHVNVRDDGYALMCLREIPDPWWGMFEKCCEELTIPYRCTRHEVSYEAYQDAVAGCRFLCAPLYELSTGGLSLMEGYHLGKPVLASDSEWNAAQEYFGDRATYFVHGDEHDFKRQLRRMYNETPPVALDHREWIETNFSDRRMVDDVLARLKANGVMR